jgi:Stress responsive A/B Barrel Domain
MRCVFALWFVLLTVGIARFCLEERQAMADEVSSVSEAAADKSAPLAHIVFFTLAESNDANRAKLVEACKKYLGSREGVVYFGVGVRAPQYDRAVNDRDYDVALHLVFATARDQNAYQTHPQHLKFVEECKGLWKQVRVFDSRLE